MTPRVALPFRRRSVGILLVAAMALAVYAPWLIRAFVIDGSPFPPLTAQWISESGQTPIRAFMASEHRPAPFWELAYAERLWRRLPDVGLLLIIAWAFAWFSPVRDRRRIGLAGFLLFGYLVWNTVPHAPDRFLATLLPALVALAALMVHDLTIALPRFGRLAALPLWLWVAMLMTSQTLYATTQGWIGAGLGGVTRDEFLERQLGTTGDFFNAINKAIEDEPDARILMLYEARAAAAAGDVTCNTVFDSSVLWNLLRSTDKPEQVLDALHAQGITHLVVNEVELARLLATYPATEAMDDPAFRFARHSASKSGNHALLLPFRRYYPPFYYYGNGQTEILERRLDQFLNHVSGQMIWQKEPGGMRMYISRF